MEALHEDSVLHEEGIAGWAVVLWDGAGGICTRTGCCTRGGVVMGGWSCGGFVEALHEDGVARGGYGRRGVVITGGLQGGFARGWCCTRGLAQGWCDWG